MDLDDLSKLNRQYADDTRQMFQEFIELFQKWKKKDARIAMINCLHMPINTLMNILLQDEESLMPIAFKDFPDVFERFLNPFVKIKNKWGKISSNEFAKLYQKEYEKQFGDELGFSKKQIESFRKWFEKENS